MGRGWIVVVVLLLAAPAARGEGETLDSVLDRLDKRARELEDALRQAGKKGAHVAALVGRAYASTLDKERAYVVATYSFEHATRDDVKLTHNDWDVLFGNGTDNLDIRTVTDDASTIWDLGELDFDSVTVRSIEGHLPEGGERAIAVESHVYVIHTLDSETDSWAKMLAIEHDPGRTLILRWEVIEDPTDVERLERREGRELKGGQVRIQVRAGAIGGNPARANMDGSVEAYIDEVSATPLDLSGEVGPAEPTRAHIEGGYIPRGKVWIVRRIDIEGTNVGDSNGGGEFVVSIGGEEILRREEGSGPFKDTWRGRIVVRPHGEHAVYAELTNSSWCDVVFRGALLDEKWADVEVLPPLSPAELATLAKLVGDLDSDDSELRDAAVRDLIAMGPPVLDSLQKVPTQGRSPEFCARLRSVIEALGGE